MFEQAERTIEFVGHLPPEAFIDALVLALVIALTTVGTYRWLAGRKPDALMPLVCLVLLANVACILAAVSFVQSTVPTIRLIERGGRPPRDRIINMYDHVAESDAPVGSDVSRPDTPD
jgi:predicted PurR-regulated permease PerM